MKTRSILAGLCFALTLTAYSPVLMAQKTENQTIDKSKGNGADLGKMQAELAAQLKRERDSLQHELSNPTLSKEEKSLIVDEVKELNQQIYSINNGMINRMKIAKEMELLKTLPDSAKMISKMEMENIPDVPNLPDMPSNPEPGTDPRTMVNVKHELESAKASLEKELENKDLPDASRDAIEDAIDKLDAQIDKLDDEQDNMRIDIDIDHPGSSAKSDTGKKKAIIITDDGYLKIKLHKDSIPEAKKRLPNTKTQLLGLDLGENFLLDNGSFTMTQQPLLDLSYPKSINVTLYLLRQGINLVTHHFYATAAIAIDYHDYRFKNNITLIPRSDVLNPELESVDFSKNKLSAQYLMVPVMLHLETNPSHPNKSFKFGVGGYGEMRIKSYTKQVSDARGKEHFRDDYSLNDLAYGVMGQVGYGGLQFYTHYSLAPLFQKDKGPELFPLTFGVVVNGFKWKS